MAAGWTKGRAAVRRAGISNHYRAIAPVGRSSTAQNSRFTIHYSILDHAGELSACCDARELSLLDDMLVKRVPLGDFITDQFCVCLVSRQAGVPVRFDALRRGRQPHLRSYLRYYGLLVSGQVSFPPPRGAVNGRVGGVDRHGQHPA